MILVISLVFIFLTTSNYLFSSRHSITEILRKIYGDPTLKLVRKFEKTDIKHKKCLLDWRFFLLDFF